MNEPIEIKTLSFSGHRQNKLNGYQAADWVRDRLADIIHRAYKADYRKFICGGALGTDWIAASEVIELSQNYQDIELILALPFKGYNSKWPLGTVERFEIEIEAQANQVVYVSEPPYAAWKMHKRNQWMVDKANALVAVWDGAPEGGTANAVEYARLRIPIYHIDPKAKKEKWGLE